MSEANDSPYAKLEHFSSAMPAPPHGSGHVTRGLDQIKAGLAGIHRDHPQRAMLAALAVDAIQASLVELAKLGHRFHLVPTTGEPPEEYPKMLYHPALGQAIVSDPEAERQLGAGWVGHPGLTTVVPVAEYEEEDPVRVPPSFNISTTDRSVLGAEVSPRAEGASSGVYQPPTDLAGMTAAGLPPPQPIPPPPSLFPKMLYKLQPGGSVDTLVVMNAEEEIRHRADGYGTRPDGVSEGDEASGEAPSSPSETHD